MIIDQIDLAGEEAYLRDGNNIDLSLPNRIGKSPEITLEGKLIEVNSLNMFIECNDFSPLFRHQPTPLLTFNVKKEIFPGLFADPYTHRIHTVGGMEDFEKGRCLNCRAMIVEGLPTIVASKKHRCEWRSPIYQMPSPITVSEAAWDLAASKLTPEDAFNYSLYINVKRVDSNQFKSIQLISGANPTQLRKSLKNLDIIDVEKYQLVFKAEINHDAYLRERHDSRQKTDNLGRPLLRSVSLLEPVSPTYEFYSLDELIQKASDYQFFQKYNEPPKQLSLQLDLTAVLSKGEEITLTVHQKGFDYLQARLDATILLRPPIEKNTLEIGYLILTQV